MKTATALINSLRLTIVTNVLLRLSMASAALAVALVLLGCAPTGTSAPPEPFGTPAPVPEEAGEAAEPSSDRSPTDLDRDPDPVTFLGCDDLVHPDEARNLLGPGFAHIPDNPKLEAYFHLALGPSAKSAIGQATRTQFCLWGMPNSDGISSFLIAELPDAPREEFLRELRASDFAESSLAGSPVFTWQNPEVKYGPATNWYGFSGNMLVAGHVYSPTENIAEVALTRMKEANPSHV